MLATDRKKRTIEGTIMKISKGILFASAVLISHNTFAEEILYKQVDAIEAVEIEVIEIEEEDEAEPYWEFLAMGAFAAINTDDFFISETENWKDKFSPDNGEIKITVEEKNSEVRVSVTNVGPTISADRIQNIMKPFNLDEDIMHHSQGLGLGISVAQSLLRRHGGNLQIQSASKVTTVTFTLQK